MSTAENFMRGSVMARNLAAQCLLEADKASPSAAARLLADRARHIARAEDYELRASWYAPKVEQEIAA